MFLAFNINTYNYIPKSVIVISCFPSVVSLGQLLSWWSSNFEENLAKKVKFVKLSTCLGTRNQNKNTWQGNLPPQVLWFVTALDCKNSKYVQQDQDKCLHTYYASGSVRMPYFFLLKSVSPEQVLGKIISTSYIQIQNAVYIRFVFIIQEFKITYNPASDSDILVISSFSQCIRTDMMWLRLTDNFTT